jgi:hypothetical protein
VSDSSPRSPEPSLGGRLVGRRNECALLEGLIDAVRGGESRAVVVSGEPGVGKTALFEYAVERASGCRIARAAGVEFARELAFAGLHQLCAPFLGRLDGLPGPQGVHGRPGRAEPALSPLICLVDDEQWLDRASAQVLSFVARRMDVESVGLLFAARETSDELAGLPELVVNGLRERDARILLDSVLTGPLDPRVRDRIVSETRGNPLALLELVRGLPPAELAGGLGLPGMAPLSGRIERTFRRRLDALPGALSRRPRSRRARIAMGCLCRPSTRE